MIADYARRPAPSAHRARLSTLSERELEVLRLIGTGRNNAEIARELVIGAGTVKTHVSNTLRKLGLRDRVHAVVLAHEAGIVTP
jgi:DNA-binding NarL/FixJ family response regulator